MFITLHSSSSQQICYLFMLSHSAGHLSNALMWTDFKLDVITFTAEVMFSVPFVCMFVYLIVCRITQKLCNPRSSNLTVMGSVSRKTPFKFDVAPFIFYFILYYHEIIHVSIWRNKVLLVYVALGCCILPPVWFAADMEYDVLSATF